MPTADASIPIRATIWQYTLFAKIEYGDSIDEDKKHCRKECIYAWGESLFHFPLLLYHISEWYRRKDKRHKREDKVVTSCLCCLFLYLRQLWQQGTISSYARLSEVVCVVSIHIRQLGTITDNYFIVQSCLHCLYYSQTTRDNSRQLFHCPKLSALSFLYLRQRGTTIGKCFQDKRHAQVLTHDASEGICLPLFPCLTNYKLEY